MRNTDESGSPTNRSISLGVQNFGVRFPNLTRRRMTYRLARIKTTATEMTASIVPEIKYIGLPFARSL